MAGLLVSKRIVQSRRPGVILLGFFVSLVAVAAPGCGRPGPREESSQRLFDASSSDGSCGLDLTGERADNVFFLLGLRNLQGVVEGSDVVEGFYCNEQTVAKLFHRRLEALAVEQGIAADVRQQTVQDCLTSYHSKILRDRLNSCYRYELTIPKSSPPSVKAPRSGATTLNLELFYRSGVGGLAPDGGLSDAVFARRRALAYLAGTWARFGQAPDFVFHANQESAEFVAALLSNLGCRDVRVEHTVGLIPGATLVHFEPTPEVAEWLRRTW